MSDAELIAGAQALKAACICTSDPTKRRSPRHSVSERQASRKGRSDRLGRAHSTGVLDIKPEALADHIEVALDRLVLDLRHLEELNVARGNDFT